MGRPIPRRAALTTLTGAMLTATATPALAQQAVLLYPRAPSLRPGYRPLETRPTGAVGLRRVTLVSAQTGETFSDIFALGNRPSTIAMARLSRLMRDPHNGATKAIDPALIEVLARMQTKLQRPIQVLSGYRSPETNFRMHMMDPGGVAEHSFHTIGKAVDFTVAGASAEALGRLARQCGAGGIGVYGSGFVHVDTGPERSWVG
ncbi:YcbK family protein [Vineibacter terrae]|uniref:YcbK family protein n=1 Tax=Vineibacter terrae TaxID=2586908 RepID=UPI002E34F6FA|nr:DUF882 domain-containing protein [Vineibacter terrae]HEX2888101.1 DUF882 domain-containing protein [Vineibacter terrae]